MTKPKPAALAAALMAVALVQKLPGQCLAVQSQLAGIHGDKGAGIGIGWQMLVIVSLDGRKVAKL